jgi:hypothetical protein
MTGAVKSKSTVVQSDRSRKASPSTATHMPGYIGLRVLAKMPRSPMQARPIQHEMHTGAPENGASVENDPRSN